MALTFCQATTRASAATSPITTGSLTLQDNEKLVVLLLKGVGSTDRAGGDPTFGGQTMTQANSTKKAASSPEASAELWYLLDPPTGTQTASIPNTGSITCFYTLATAKASNSTSGRVTLDGSSGGNATGTNPTPGAINTTEYNTVGFAVVASGATDFDPATPSGTGLGAGTGTPLGTFDDGANGGGQQYHNKVDIGAFTLGWTFGTSDDWGCVAAYFKESPLVSTNNYLFIKGADGISVTEKIR